MTTAGLKDRALQAYYESLFAMHGTPGWQNLMQDVDQMEASHDRLEGLSTAEQLHVRQGQLDMIRWLKNHAATVENSYNALVAEQEDVGEPEATGGRAQVQS